jgi:dynein light intermediate chain 1
MEFWILEDALGLQSLLELALPASRLLNSTVLVVLDLARPWSLMLQLNTAVEFLNTYLRTLPSELLQQGRAAVERRFQTYAEPGTAAPTGDLPPLPAGVCEESLGVPLLVVVNKSDLLGQLSSELGYRADHWEFIQTALRRWCLARGAGLVFASGRKALNVALLGRYLRHVGLGAALPDAAQLAEKELLFVPAGWDSAARIEMDFRAQKLTNDSGLPYEEVLRPPPALRAAEAAAADTEALLQAEDDQRFLQTQLTILGSAPRLDEPATAQLVASAGPSAPTPATSPAAAVLAALSQPPSAEPPRTPSKLDARAGSASGTPTASSPQPEHQVLANFFNSLINKSSSPARKPAASLFSREEAEKELERLKGTPKKT